jgi:hypothetical protein
MDDRMRSILYRASCPSSLELGEYHLAVLSKERAAFIKKHLKECSHCSLELQQLKTFLADVKPDLEYSLADRIKVWVAERLPEISSGAPAPAFSLRGKKGTCLPSGPERPSLL